MKKTLTDKEREIINLGISIAAGCQPCTRYHINKCKEARIPDQDINMIIWQTKQICLKSIEIMILRAITSININNKKEIDFHLKNNKRKEILNGLAVSYTINNTDLFDFYMEHADNQDISKKEILYIIETAKFIYSKAKAHIDILCEQSGFENQSIENEDCSPGCGC